MNNDNILIKIVSTFNEGIFSNTDYDMKVSDAVSKALSYGGYDVSDCRFKVKNISGNLDMCFIYDEVNTDEDTHQVIAVDDARGTRIMVVIFVNELLSYLRRIKPSDSHPYCYKIYDGSGNFLGYAKKYTVKDNKMIIKPEDFDRKLPKNRAYQVPTNKEYINELSRVFEDIVNMVKPNTPFKTILTRVYDVAPSTMALYSHKVTIGDVTYGDFRSDSIAKAVVDMINNYDLLELLDGKILEAYDGY